jgi:hypothetical protein
MIGLSRNFQVIYEQPNASKLQTAGANLADTGSRHPHAGSTPLGARP